MVDALNHRFGPPAALLGRWLTATWLGPRLIRPARSRLASGTDPVSREVFGTPAFCYCGGLNEGPGDGRWLALSSHGDIGSRLHALFSALQLPILAALLALGFVGGCKKQGEVVVPAGQTIADGTSGGGMGLSAPISGSVSRSLHLRIYPDMAVPGREVVVEVQVVPDPVGEEPQYSFRAPQNPCGGDLDVKGNRLIYKVPPDCRGSGITFVASASGSFGVLEREVRLDIKKAVFMESVVFSYPIPGQKLASPVAIWWDRTLYLNRHEMLSFTARRGGETVIETGTVNPDTVLELDLSPSPEPVEVFGRTSSGTEERVQLRIHERVVPSWDGGVVMLDPFTDAERTGTGTTRDLLDAGGKCQVGLGRRVGPAGDTAFLFLQYHVARSKLLGKGDAFIGFSERVGMPAPASEYDQLILWLKGDAVHTPASPVYVRVEGSNGSKRTFKIKRLQDHWRPYHFPIARTLRRGASEELRRILVYVDARDVTPALGTVLFGAMYLEPFAKKKPAGEGEGPGDGSGDPEPDKPLP